MNLMDVYVSLLARWRTALIVLIAVVGATAAFTLTRVPQYTAQASVVLDVRTPDPIAAAGTQSMAGTAYMVTQVNVLRSERVAVRALDALGLSQDPDRQAQWRAATNGVGSFESWLADGLLLKLDAAPPRDSNVIDVFYTSPDPVFAAKVVNAWVKAYVDTTLELRVEPAKRYNSFFDNRSKELREQLEAAQSRLSAFQQKMGIVATEERLDVENSRLSELSSQVVQLQGLANESSGRQRQSAQNASDMNQVFSSPVLVSMTTDLARAKTQLNELGERLGANHPAMAELRAKIAQLESGIAAETRRVASSLSIDDRINQTRLAQAQAAVAEQRAKLLQLRTHRDEMAVLERDVESARRSYDTTLARLAQTSVESQTNQTNVSLLKEATPPAYPASPRVRLNITIGFLVGCLLAVAGAVVRELLDRRLRTDHDVLSGLDVPLLGVLPAKAGAKRIGASRRRLRLTLSSAPPKLS
ncbi:chain length determinant protein EpsF [Pseudorhodoferax sp. Leaf274]|uniref:chain length determinant protein EpsF n=1 Tax=Pseudorhodoferax sp. Leaf274 TaxID=1736318 RepID=UPI00070380AD|nr:chain length determinant protein EpsF [Pseudorhodoferax sp. Leaf274]KQP43203.1 hypothetical protein ASF44_06445 [Pseudorhodoferax sp. Leaf274]